MYLEYYNLRIKPFDLSLRPGFLWLGEKHSEALATLKYGVQEDLGFLLLTGDVGAGKTVMIRRLVNSLDKESTVVAHITDPELAPDDFFKMLASEFKFPGSFQGKAEFLIQFERFLNRAHADRKKVLLIVDEAQRLNDSLLDQIRVLSNIEKANKKLINIFFVGQPEFKNMLLTVTNRPLRQRIAVNYQIDPLTAPEVGEYIAYRLKKAGRNQNLFTPDAVTEIFKFTNGYPRAINIICDHALLTGFTSGLQTIDSNVIKECKQELNIRAEGVSEAVQEKKGKPKPVPKPKKPAPPSTPEKPRTTVSPVQERRASPLGGYALIIGVCLLLSILLVYLLFRPDSEDMNREIASEQSEGFTNQPKNPLENNEWRLEDKMEMEKSYASSKLPTETAEHDPSPTESVGTTQNETDRPSGLDTKGSEITTMPTPEDTKEIKQPAPTVEKKADKSVEDKTAALADPPPKKNSDKTVAVAEQPVKTSGNTSSVSLPDKSLQAMAVMSAAMASKPESQAKPTPPKQTTAKSSATKPKKEPKTTQPKKTTTKTSSAKPKTTATSDKTASAPKKKPAKKAEAKSRVTPIEKTKPNTALAAVVAAPKPKKPVTPPVSKTVSPSTAKSITTTGTASSKSTKGSQIIKKDTRQATVATSASTSTTASKASADKNDDAGLENRLRWFLKSYCVTYTRKDIDAFSKFFVPGATENGKPFESLIPKYKRNFERIETIQYRIDLQSFSYDKNKETIVVEGDFALQWLPGDRKWRENSGTISMNLIDNGPSFLVQSLDYRGNRSKKK